MDTSAGIPLCAMARGTGGRVREVRLDDRWEYFWPCPTGEPAPSHCQKRLQTLDVQRQTHQIPFPLRLVQVPHTEPPESKDFLICNIRQPVEFMEVFFEARNSSHNRAAQCFLRDREAAWPPSWLVWPVGRGHRCVALPRATGSRTGGSDYAALSSSTRPRPMARRAFSTWLIWERWSGFRSLRMAPSLTPRRAARATLVMP